MYDTRAVPSVPAGACAGSPGLDDIVEVYLKSKCSIPILFFFRRKLPTGLLVVFRCPQRKTGVCSMAGDRLKSVTRYFIQLVGFTPAAVAAAVVYVLVSKFLTLQALKRYPITPMAGKSSRIEAAVQEFVCTTLTNLFVWRALSTSLLCVHCRPFCSV